MADAFQFISYYHTADYIRNLHEAYKREESPATKDAPASPVAGASSSFSG